MLYSTEYQSPLGALTLACREDGAALAGLWMEAQKYFGCAEALVRNDALPLFAEAEDWLDRYFAGEKPEVSALPLAPEGGPFRQRVWALLRAVPYGKTVTYGQLAARLDPAGGGRGAARAVGGAVGHNPISVIIPCHRVVGADGSLTGYAGGLERKLLLLRLEGVDIARPGAR